MEFIDDVSNFEFKETHYLDEETEGKLREIIKDDNSELSFCKTNNQLLVLKTNYQDFATSEIQIFNNDLEEISSFKLEK